jgi:hypothetical protein
MNLSHDIEDLAQAVSDTDARVDALEIRVAAVERSIKASALLAVRKDEVVDSTPGYGKAHP